MTNQDADHSRPLVGVAVLITDDHGGVLMGLRKGSHGPGTWCLPGGHLEYGESFEDCAMREVKEETGLVLSDLKLMSCTNDVFEDEKKHYVTVWMRGTKEKDAMPQLMEPDKCEKWDWAPFSHEAVLGKGGSDRPLFLPIINFFRQHPDFYL